MEKLHLKLTLRLYIQNKLTENPVALMKMGIMDMSGILTIPNKT